MSKCHIVENHMHSGSNFNLSILSYVLNPLTARTYEKELEMPVKEAFRETWLCDIAQKMEGTELTVDEALEYMAKTGNRYII